MAARQGGCRELHTCTMATINDRRQRMKPPKGNDHARGSNPSRAIEVCPHTLGPPQAMKNCADGASYCETCVASRLHGCCKHKAGSARAGGGAG